MHGNTGTFLKCDQLQFISVTFSNDKTKNLIVLNNTYILK